MNKARHIPLSGTPNLRDLGGYTSRCGRTVQHGRLFRSGTLAYLDEADWQTLAEHNISVICDFRREDEQSLEPTTVPGDMELRIIELPVGAGSHTGFVRDLVLNQASDPDGMARLMMEINRAFVHKQREPFKRLVESVLDLADNEAILFHCSAGKDRTGFAAAILLGCLNVGREQILEDYLLTRKHFDPNEQLEHLQKRFSQESVDADLSKRLIPVLETRPEYLGAAFEEIDAHWGDMDTFLKEAMGLDDATQAAMRERFLD